MWYQGNPSPDGYCPEFDEAHSFPIIDQLLRPVLLTGQGQNRDGLEVRKILTTAHREFGGCAHCCAGKLKCREQA